MASTQSGYTGPTAGAQLINGGARKGNLHVVSLAAAGAAATVAIYDSVNSVSGNPIASLAAPIGKGAVVNYDGQPFQNGLWAVVVGSGSALSVSYE
jgi:hypothetical protein